MDEKVTEIQKLAVWEVIFPTKYTIPPTASLLDAARVMADKKLNRLIVKPKYGPMLGIITSTDVVFAVLGCDAVSAQAVDAMQFMYSPCEESEDCSISSNPPVREHMTRTEISCVAPDMSLFDAATVLRAAHVTGAPVMSSDDTLVGVLSRNDIMRALLSIPASCDTDEKFACEVRRVAHEKVETVMTSDLRTVTPDMSLMDAANVMAAERLNRLLVTRTVDAKAPGALCGILSSTDVVFAMLGCDFSSDSPFGDEEELDSVLSAEGRGGNLYRKGIY